MAKYILKNVEPEISVYEESKEDFKKLMGWDEKTFLDNVHMVKCDGCGKEEYSLNRISTTGYCFELCKDCHNDVEWDIRNKIAKLGADE